MYSMRMARAKVNFTKKQMAEALEIHEQTYAKYESNPDEMSIKLAKRFSEITGISIEDIFLAKSV